MIEPEFAQRARHASGCDTYFPSRTKHPIVKPTTYVIPDLAPTMVEPVCCQKSEASNTRQDI